MFIIKVSQKTDFNIDINTLYLKINEDTSMSLVPTSKYAAEFRNLQEAKDVAADLSFFFNQDYTVYVEDFSTTKNLVLFHCLHNLNELH